MLEEDGPPIRLKRGIMNAKQWCLLGLVGVLGSLYVCFFTDWFRSTPFRIEHTVRPLREAWRNGTRMDTSRNSALSVTFALHQTCRLLSVEVVPLNEFLTNRFAHPLWQLVSKEGSDPVNSIAYGVTLPGMKPSVQGAEAEPLLPNVEYRLLIESRKQKGQHDFKIKPLPAPPR